MDPFIIDKFTREMCCARQRVLARPSFNNTKTLAAVHEIWAIFFPATTPSIVLFMALQALLVDPQCECVWPRLRNVFLESSISTREPHSSHWVCEFLAVFQSSCFSQMFGCCGCAFFFFPFCHGRQMYAVVVEGGYRNRGLDKNTEDTHIHTQTYTLTSLANWD